MNLSNIETFVAVVKFMNFSKAADSLFVSQSTVTSRIKSLEDELNIQLFAREGKSISLTAVGERFFEHAVKIQELLAATEQDIAMYNKYSSCLSICAPDSVWEYTLADYASRFMASHPETAMKLKCGHSEFVISDLLLGLADIGVVFQRVHDDEIESREFFRRLTQQYAVYFDNLKFLINLSLLIQSSLTLTHNFKFIFIPNIFSKSSLA